MAVQVCGDIFARQGSMSIDQTFQPVIIAVQGVSAKRLCCRKVQNFVEKRFTSIYSELLKGLSSTLEKGRPQLTRTALNAAERHVSNCIGASSNVAHESCHDSRRQSFLLGKELPIAYVIIDLKNRQQQGIRIDSYTLVDVLKLCSEQKDLIATRQVHDCIIQIGMDKHPYVVTSLMNAYVRCGGLQDARRVFDGLEKKTNFTWSIMIGGYAKNDHAEDALEIFNRMRQEGAQPGELLCLSILKACARPSALKWGKEVHAYIRHAGLESDIRVGTSLVQMYAKCGCVTEARRIFEKLGTNRNAITWTVMIGAYAASGCGVEAYGLFLQMQREGFRPNAMTYMSILNPSASAGALEWVKEVHSHALKAGLESDLRVGNVLVQMYAKSGSIDDARLIFDRLKTRDVITWNMMIGAYAKSGCGVEAYRLFLQMKLESFIPNAITYVSILNGSASAGALEWVKEVHSHALKAGLESDLRVGTALVQMYAKIGSIDDARLVFHRMEKRDDITWNIMIAGLEEHGCGHEALQLSRRQNFVRGKELPIAYAIADLKNRQQQGISIDSYTLVGILKRCSEQKDLVVTRQVHDNVIQIGMDKHPYVVTSLMNAYVRCGGLQDARRVFDGLEKKTNFTWNIMIGGYAKSDHAEDALEIFNRMRQEGAQPGENLCLSILKACARPSALKWGKEVHAYIRHAGLESDIRVGSALVQMYAKCGCITEARRIFEKLGTNRNAITWTVMIGAYAESGCGVEAYQLFLQMKREGFVPNAITYVSILQSSASAGALEWVKEVHSHALKAGLESDLRVGTALVQMYVKIGSIDDARLVFHRMEKRDEVTWNVMIAGLAEHGCGHEALELFRTMNVERVKPDATSFVAVLSACCHAGLLDDGRRLFLAMTQDYGIKPTVVHCTCMVDLFGRAGRLEEAKLLIDEMPVEPDEIIWRALLGACRTHGNLELGELAAKEVLKLEPKDAATYIVLSNIYAAAGKWEKVSSVSTMMQRAGVRKEPGRSWIEVDDKIHEFVAGDTSHPESKAIYTELSKLTEKLKAEGYIPDTQLVLQNIDEEDKELALCSHSEKLAIAYGLMRTPCGKPIRVYKNLRVCSDCHTATKFTSKVTGREIIARDANRFHHFKDGVCSCGDYW